MKCRVTQHYDMVTSRGVVTFFITDTTKETIDRLTLMIEQEINSSQNNDLMVKVKQEAESMKKNSANDLITYIRVYRQLTGAGLRESKDWVEHNFPHLKFKRENQCE